MTHLPSLVLLVDSISAVVVEEVATLVIEVVWHVARDRFVDVEMVLAVPTPVIPLKLCANTVVCLVNLLRSVV